MSGTIAAIFSNLRGRYRRLGLSISTPSPISPTWALIIPSKSKLTYLVYPGCIIAAGRVVSLGCVLRGR